MAGATDQSGRVRTKRHTPGGIKGRQALLQTRTRVSNPPSLPDPTNGFDFFIFHFKYSPPGPHPTTTPRRRPDGPDAPRTLQQGRRSGNQGHLSAPLPPCTSCLEVKTSIAISIRSTLFPLQRLNSQAHTRHRESMQEDTRPSNLPLRPRFTHFDDDS